MRRAQVFVQGQQAAILTEISRHSYELTYEAGYKGHPVSLALPVKEKHHTFSSFPAFFEGLLPEGLQLEALLKQEKIDRNDLFSQLMAVGQDLVGAVTVKEIKS